MSLNEYQKVGWLVGLCCLMTPGLSKDIRCHVLTILFTSKCKSADQTSATHKVRWQPGDFDLKECVITRSRRMGKHLQNTFVQCMIYYIKI